ncbi:hypothetical protein LJC23_07630, partial [Desulfovibrio sp. OttesenSCG-928-I05]|nr:hypothetical protein [Desulfovibrio sp. OttesenSCG-928-I05]
MSIETQRTPTTVRPPGSLAPASPDSLPMPLGPILPMLPETGMFFESAARLSPEALFNLAMQYEHGAGRPRDRAMAKHLLRSAADKGAVPALMHLAEECLKDGRITEGRGLLLHALTRGHAPAAEELANSYYRDDGDMGQAMRYWNEGARRGHARCAQRLAFLHELGCLGQEAP